MLNLLIRNAVFTVVVPGLGGAWVPAWLLTRDGGTPGPWDAPRRVVTRGPHGWVRNPIYLAALLVVLGEAGLFGSLRLLAYAGAMAVCFHLFVIGYEEPALLSVHAVTGLLLGLGALAVLIQAVLARHRAAISRSRVKTITGMTISP
jgi:protein-S-isoprenylcysteine O-methyltransferase Ste14